MDITSPTPPIRQRSKYRDGPLPKAQKKMLMFIRAEIASGRPFPSTTVLQRFMGYNGCSGIQQCLCGLNARGLIVWAGTGRRRALIWRLVPESAITEPSLGAPHEDQNRESLFAMRTVR